MGVRDVVPGCSRSRQSGLWRILLAAMIVHGLGIGLIAVLAMISSGHTQRRWPGQLTLVPAAVVVAASLILMPLLHGLILGKIGYTPGGPAFVYGRLVQDKIAQRWLAEHCPVPGIALCRLQERLPESGDAFLWNTQSFFFIIGVAGSCGRTPLLRPEAVEIFDGLEGGGLQLVLVSGHQPQ